MREYFVKVKEFYKRNFFYNIVIFFLGCFVYLVFGRVYFYVCGMSGGVVTDSVLGEVVLGILGG